jgi:ribose transport system permease protein
MNNSLNMNYTESKKPIGQKLLAFAKSKELMLFYILLVICSGISIINPQFITIDNLLTIIKQTTIVTIVAAGQTFVIASGGIDLSVGYLMGMSTILMPYALSKGVGIVPAILIGIAVSTMLGLLNGVMITKLKLPPFIITLGMANIARGMILVITQGFVIPVKNELISFLGMGDIGIFPVMTLFLPVFVFLGWFILRKSVFGSHVLAIGGNETATRLSGVRVHLKKTMVYTLCGFFCGIAGILMTARLNGGNPNAGLSIDMDSIGAVIIGGTSLSGGSGTVIGTMIGAILMGVIRNGLVLVNVDLYWQTIVTGVIVITVCALKENVKTRKPRA